ncbi:MAG: map, partial [Ilumatobacteraceae bacterium]|nr:map [Ilumatobacteraceae bacterium]
MSVMPHRAPVHRGRVEPPRAVPAGIARPPYVASGRVVRQPGFEILRGADLTAMRAACRVAAEVLIDAGRAVAPGVTTAELDEVAHTAYISRGAYPSTLGYQGFTKSVCTSVNEVVCHGIPDSRPLVEGDIVNIDVTAYLEGFHGDTSATFCVGEVDSAMRALIDATRDATLAGIRAVRRGGELRAIGRAVESVAIPRGYGIVSKYGGHGIGRVFHADPHVHHTDVRQATTRFEPGMCFTVEPMLTAGSSRLEQWSDGWTEVTSDGLPSAQFEHTVVVTEIGFEILTVTADGTSAVDAP